MEKHEHHTAQAPTKVRHSFKLVLLTILWLATIVVVAWKWFPFDVYTGPHNYFTGQWLYSGAVVTMNRNGNLSLQRVIRAKVKFGVADDGAPLFTEYVDVDFENLIVLGSWHCRDGVLIWSYKIDLVQHTLKLKPRTDFAQYGNAVAFEILESDPVPADRLWPVAPKNDVTPYMELMPQPAIRVARIRGNVITFAKRLRRIKF